MSIARRIAATHLYSLAPCQQKFKRNPDRPVVAGCVSSLWRPKTVACRNHESGYVRFETRACPRTPGQLRPVIDTPELPPEWRLGSQNRLTANACNSVEADAAMLGNSRPSQFSQPPKQSFQTINLLIALARLPTLRTAIWPMQFSGK